MILPPLMVRLRWGRRWPPGIWIPLFLLWPLVLLLAVPILLLAAGVALSQGWFPRFLQGVAAAYRVVCESRGIRIDVGEGSSRLSIRMY